MLQYEITELARKYGPWSFSKAELAQVCPAQFRHKYLAKTEGAPVVSDNKVGLVSHEILEKRVGGAPLGIARREALEKNPLTSEEQEELKMLSDNMEHFLQRFDRFCKAERVKQVFTETKWAFTADYEASPFFGKDVYFRGAIDLGAITGDDVLFVLDHKSGVAKDLTQDQPKRAQLQSYAVLAAPNLPNIAGVRGGIHFMQGDNPDLRLQWMDFIPIDVVQRAYAPWLFDFINKCAQNLAHERFSARPAKKADKWPCGWCSYRTQCPDFKEKFGGA